MAFSNGDAKKEIAEITSGIGSDERPVSSLKEAFKLVAIYPVMMFLSVVLLWLVFYATMVFAGEGTVQNSKFYFEAALLIMGDGGWFSLGATIIAAIFFMLINYSTVLIYLSVPADIRSRSIIIGSIKAMVKKISLILWGGATLLSLAGIFSGWIILLAGSIPFVLFMSIFIINGYIGMQGARYGLGPLMSTANKMLGRQ